MLAIAVFRQRDVLAPHSPSISACSSHPNAGRVFPTLALRGYHLTLPNKGIVLSLAVRESQIASDAATIGLHQEDRFHQIEMRD